MKESSCSKDVTWSSPPPLSDLLTLNKAGAIRESMTDLFFHENGKTHSCATPQQQQHTTQDRQRIRRSGSSVDKFGREEKKCSTALQVLFPNDSPPLSLSLSRVVSFHSPRRLQKHVPPPPPPPFLFLSLSLSKRLQLLRTLPIHENRTRPYRSRKHTHTHTHTHTMAVPKPWPYLVRKSSQNRGKSSY